MSDRYDDISRWRRRRRAGETVREIAEDEGERLGYVKAAIYGQVAYHGPEEPPVSPEEQRELRDGRGEDAPSAKMAEEIVIWSRQERRDGTTYASMVAEIRRRWGVEVTRQALRQAVIGETWAHLEEPPVR